MLPGIPVYDIVREINALYWVNTTLVPIFAKRGVFFQWEVRIREIKKKWVILQAWVREILKRGKIWHVFIVICLFRMFDQLCINVFEL